MTALEVIQAVEAAGGAIRLNGDKLGYRLPRRATELLDALCARRAAVVQILRQRAEAAEWISQRCVGCSQARSNPCILYREYRHWTKDGTVSYHEFLQALAARGWQLDQDGMVAGVCLDADFLNEVEQDAYNVG